MTAPDTAPARILVVDDEPLNRSVLRVMLGFEGYTVLEASSGEEGIRVAREQVPDLILLDVMMPGLDGFATARRLREDAVTTHIPIIVVTAMEDRQSSDHALRAGAEMFISKPIVRAELYSVVRTALAPRD